MTPMLFSPALGLPVLPPALHEQTNGPMNDPRERSPARAGVGAFTNTPLACADPGHQEGVGIARRLHSQLDAVGGIAYLTRGPQGVASGLGKTPLEQTGHENSAPIGDDFPVEALGAFQAIHGVGGAIETGTAIKHLSNTCRALSNRHATHDAFQQGQLALDEAHRRWRHGAANPSLARPLCDAAREAWSARSSLVQLNTAIRQAPEQIVDVIRYTAVSWTSRLLSVLKLAFKASAWISLAASIVGVLGSAFQVLAGIFKWHSASAMVRRARSALHQVESQPPADHPTPLQTHVIQHVCRQRKHALQQALDKRTRARVETITGIAALVFSALAFLFPPLAFVAIATGLAYAGYRVYRGVCSFLSTREANRREMAQRIDFSDPAFVEALDRSARSEGRTAAQLNVAADNPYYAIHCLIEHIQEGEAAWLHGLLEQLGVSQPDRDAVFLLAQSHDTAQAGRCLERMLFEGDWSALAGVATA